MGLGKAIHKTMGKIKRKPNLGSKANLEARKREQRALELRLGGFSYAQIGQKMGVSDVAAYQMIMRVLDKQLADTVELVPKARQIELNRCDTYLASMLPKCKKGDINAILASLKVAERRARLAGLDSAIKVDPLAGEGGAVAVEVFRKMLEDATKAATGTDEEKA